mgnify:CR=1 FL=1
MTWECREIKSCVACGSSDLVPVLDLGSQPLANSYKKEKYEPQQEFPLAINRCEHCFHVQLTHQVNPELMFKDYAYVSGTAKTSLEYFEWLRDRIVLTLGRTPSNILDIGCNDGSFLNAWGGTGTITYGVDPAENLHHLSKIYHRVHCGFFSGKEFLGEKFDVITCMNAFAHNENQLELLKNMGRRLTDTGLIFVTTSQADMILNGEFDTIYHEHVSFYNIRSMNALCERAGLNLVDVIKHPIHGTSYIFVISRTTEGHYPVDENIEKGLYDPQTYVDYAEKAYTIAAVFGETIRKCKWDGYMVIGYGAPAKGNTLMNFAKEGPDLIYEDNPLKQGLYTPGLGIPIAAPSWGTIENIKVCWIPLAWNFFDEIVEKIKKHRNNPKDIFLRIYDETHD